MQVQYSKNTNNVPGSTITLIVLTLVVVRSEKIVMQEYSLSSSIVMLVKLRMAVIILPFMIFCNTASQQLKHYILSKTKVQYSLQYNGLYWYIALSEVHNIMDAWYYKSNKTFINQNEPRYLDQLLGCHGRRFLVNQTCIFKIIHKYNKNYSEY